MIPGKSTWYPHCTIPQQTLTSIVTAKAREGFNEAVPCCDRAQQGTPGPANGIARHALDRAALVARAEADMQPSAQIDKACDLRPKGRNRAQTVHAAPMSRSSPPRAAAAPGAQKHRVSLCIEQLHGVRITPFSCRPRRYCGFCRELRGREVATTVD